MEERRLRCLLLAALFTAQLLVARSIDPSKCSACEAVAAELESRLENERPRNSLDVRHRLDKHGKRYGKVIDFAVSELRAIELLDDLCDEMKKYQLGSDPDSEDAQIWVLSADVAPYQEGDKEPPSKDLLKEQRRVLSNACADIVGRWEEDLTVAIREGKAGDPSVREVLCVKLGGYCESDGFYGFEGSDEL